MPEVTINMAAGRTDEQKAAIMRDITTAIATHAGVDPENIVIQINEAPLTNKMKGGKTFVERKAAQGK
ncbi:tautomerase [Rhodopseudomonas palustris]|uniref:tautomerase family protein n=1 Tax=Rhodopseudomonas TaxID=1073 RepID=UPI000D19FF7A|nr:tautomerase family protein [Rhodopseudomonas palustris]AVT75298.1 tautomerase [Rhodopseudomonas palustris]